MANQQSNKNLVIVYKLLIDIAVILLVIFFLLMLAEAALPGLISAYLSFTKILFVIILDLSAIVLLGNKYKFGSDKPINETKKSLPLGKTELILLFFTLLITMISLLKVQWIFLSVIAIIVLSIFFYLYKIFFSSEEKF